MLLEEAIVGFVLIEGVDHVVAVTPGFRVGHVHFAAGALGVANNIQPMPTPALAKLGTLQHEVDGGSHGLVRIFGPQELEPSHLFGSRW